MKLTLRELFALTLIAALIVAWWLDHRRQDAEIRKVQVELDHARLEAERNRVILLLQDAQQQIDSDVVIKAQEETKKLRQLLVDSAEAYKAQSEPDEDSTAPVP